jgi:hypothetical protein
MTTILAEWKLNRNERIQLLETEKGMFLKDWVGETRVTGEVTKIIAHISAKFKAIYRKGIFIAPSRYDSYDSVGCVKEGLINLH